MFSGQDFLHLRLANARRTILVLGSFGSLNSLGNPLLVDKRNQYLYNHLSKRHTETGPPREWKVLETQVELQKKQEGTYCLIDFCGLLKHSVVPNEKQHG